MTTVDRIDPDFELFGLPPVARERHSLVREHNDQTVLESVFRHGPISRVAVAERTGLSKPTVNTVVGQLVLAGLVSQVGVSSGSVGRSAAMFAVNPSAATVVGVDVGATRLRVAVSDLFGEVLHNVVLTTNPRGGLALLNQIASAARRSAEAAAVPWDSVKAVVIGMPGVLDPATDHLRLAFNIHGLDDVRIRHELSRRLGPIVVVDNDVNLAAVGESWRGCARGQENFTFLAIGNGVGMGIVSGGLPLRGAHGAAGEVSFLPIGADPFDTKVARHGALEEAISASGVRRRCRQARRDYPGTQLGSTPTVERIFQSAADGDPLGRAVLAEEARLITLAILSTCALLNPELLVLGGGVGANSHLVQQVQETAAKTLPYPLDIAGTELGELAAMYGALSVGLRIARSSLLT